jgi:23S rRNA pseudouridine1911/1915/1917 synthase
MVFTRNSKTAARVAEQFREHTVKKTYWVLLGNPPDPTHGVLEDWLIKDKQRAFVEVASADDSQAREATLSYETLRVQDGVALVQVQLHTGRTHQIRVQFTSRGWPVLGDLKYGGSEWKPANAATTDDQTRWVGLHAVSLELKHPIRYDELKLTAPLPNWWPAWTKE